MKIFFLVLIVVWVLAGMYAPHSFLYAPLEHPFLLMLLGIIIILINGVKD